jgi:hypothetical protein
MGNGGGLVFDRLRAWFVSHVWYIQPERVLLVKATPDQCMHTLARAARPSTERLHLRNLFSDGRRYYLKPTDTGFQLNSTSRIPWRRGRGRIASVLLGNCSEIDAGVTRIDLRARMTFTHFADVFLLPGWMGLLLISGPLPLPLGVGLSVVLLALSWIWHWYAAVLQATEMTYFVQVALDDLPAATIPELRSSDNVIHAEFQQQWQKFYEQHKDS